jgi:protein gp37
MTRTTNIEWTNHTWVPWAGCDVVSPGCTNCYAMRLAGRLQGRVPAYAGTVRQSKAGPVWTGVVNRASDTAFYKPRAMKTPALFFISSMSDFFHEEVPDEWRLEALAIMKECRRHIFQILTKRTETALAFFGRHQQHPAPNVWMGASVESQAYHFRADDLLGIDARVRFLSIEPLLAPVTLRDDVLEGLHWVIVGGESGPGARPCKAEWVTRLMWQCTEAGVPFFFKQWGTRQNNPLWDEGAGRLREPDDNGHGGALLHGKLFRAMPRDWYDWGRRYYPTTEAFLQPPDPIGVAPEGEAP